MVAAKRVLTGESPGVLTKTAMAVLFIGVLFMGVLFVGVLLVKVLVFVTVELLCG